MLVDTRGLIRVDDRPTITKTRLVGLAEHRHRQQILRVDDEIVRPPAAADRDRLLAAVEEILPSADVVCLEDYDKGTLAPDVAQGVIARARAAGKPVFVDPARTPQWERYAGATLLTPNRAELEIAAGRRVPDDELEAVGHSLLERYDCHALLITLGRDGALLLRADRPAQRFPTRPRAVYDNTGAGDAVLAMTAVAAAAGARSSRPRCWRTSPAGWRSASSAVSRSRTRRSCASCKHALEHGRGKLRSDEELAAELDARRQRGETVVFTNGCFDILHPGHVTLLEQARALGSLLVVGINSDESVRRQGKGTDRPIRSQADRGRMLAALECVDYVVVFDEDTPARVIELVAPDVLVKGGDWRGNVVGQEFVEARGGRVELIELVEGYSTTQELEKIRRATQDA
jgi:D-beta-D-heptose 7-phosphate kinase/D-beta-D-heptose 1-phosphate adenosyltransferase